MMPYRTPHRIPHRALLFSALLLCTLPAQAQTSIRPATPAAPAAQAARPAPAAQPAAATQAAPAKANSPLAGFGSGSKEPYKIDANTLEVQQKDNKAVYAGDVVVVHGKITMRCTSLAIFFEQKKEDANKAPKAAAATPGAPGASGPKRLECHGPVSVTQDKQTATSNLLVYEADVVTLTGNVILADGDNVQAGEKLVYNTKSGIGTMQGDKQNQRIRGIFIPGSAPDADPAKKAGGKPKTG